MKSLSFELGDSLSNALLVLGSRKTGKPLLSCYISKTLVEEQGLDAGKIIRELGKYIQGGGGGQAFFATAGGKRTEGIAEAIRAAKEICIPLN
jgi:alanyl-tRNA synthetase